MTNIAFDEETDQTVHDVAKLDEISALGFLNSRRDQTYIATEINGNRVFAENDLNKLLIEVREAVQQSGLSETAMVHTAGFTPEDFENEKILDAEEIDPSSDEAIAGELLDDKLSDEFVEAVKDVLDDGQEPITNFQRDPDEEESSDDDDEETEVEADTKGNKFLPGMAPKLNKELTNAALAYHSIKMQRVALTKQETEARDDLKVMVAKHKNLFVPDPDNSDCVIYRVANIVVRDKIIQDEKITTEEVDED